MAGRAVAGVGAAHPGLGGGGPRPPGAAAGAAAGAGATGKLRPHLNAWLRPEGELLDEESARWLARWCLQLGQLNRAVLAGSVASGSLVTTAALSPSTASATARCRRACIRRAVELGCSPSIRGRRPRGRAQRKAARMPRSVAVRSLPDPRRW